MQDKINAFEKFANTNPKILFLLLDMLILLKNTFFGGGKY
jgi:hypothetical protein